MTDDDLATLGRRTVLGMTGLGILGLGASAADAQEGDDGSSGYDAEDVLEDWDQKQTDTAHEMMDKYGDPDEVIPSRLIWHQEDDDSPWKHTVVYRDAVPHNFPVEHPDFLEQSIDLHISPDQYDEVAKFDGSVIVERTKGEVKARCDKEPMNFLAINLAHELATTDMYVEEARRHYAADAMAFMNGENPPRTQGFQFELPDDNQRDPDVTVIKNGEIQMDRDEGPASGDDMAADDETMGDETTDNATAGNETMGNATAGNETAGNATGE